MAAGDAKPVPRKGVATRIYFPIFDADGDLVFGATGLDSEVSIDGGSNTDCTNEAVEIGTSFGWYYLDLTSSETNGDAICGVTKTSTSGAKTTPWSFYPEELGDIRVDVQQISGDSGAADNAESFFDGTGYAGTNNVIPTVNTTTNVTTVNGLAAGVITATSIASDAITAAKIADGAIDAATFAAGAINAAAIAADAITDAKVASDVTIASVTGAVGSVTSGVTVTTNNDKTGYSLSSAGVQAIWDALTSALTAVGSIGKLLVDNINATISSRASQTSVDTVDDFLDTEIAAILAAVDTEIATLVTNVSAILADTGTDGVVLSTAVKQAIADEVLKRGVSNTEDTASAASLTELILMALESSASGSTLTIRKTGGSTFSTRTLTLDNTAEPITGIT